MDTSSEPPVANIVHEESDIGELQYNGVDFDKLTREDMIGAEFKTVEEAENFYYAYARAIGFDVRKGYMRVSTRVPGRVTSRMFVCSAEGRRQEEYKSNSKRIRTQKKETRWDCPCLFKIRYNSKKVSYVVQDFKTDHSHQLAQSFEAHLLKSHRSVPDSHIALATSMQKVSIKPCHAYEYIVDRYGGFRAVGCTIKDLYNKIDKTKREIMLHGDAEAALAYIRGKFSTDSKMYCKFSIDEDNRLANIFWRDSNSLVDYSCFGDVLLFDSTYKTNAYGQPLVLFVGSNNHLSTAVFGFALLIDETFVTYKWVLETFLSSMNNKKPVAILTDGDEAMRLAIEAVLPGCPHRLCTWHISQNAQRNLHNPKIVSQFRKCMWDQLTADQFEECWNAMVVTYSLHDKDWIKMMYEKRQKWAEAFVSGQFYARMRSTQRCEGMNKYVKRYLNTGAKFKLFELIPALDRALLRLRNKVLVEDFHTNNSTHVLTTPGPLRNLEHHASTIFTDKVFEEVRTEINGVGGVMPSEIISFGSSRVYLTSSSDSNNEEKEYTTTFYNTGNIISIDCSCKLFEREGIPCAHIFHVLKQQRMQEIPPSLLLKRWTKSPKSDMETSVPIVTNEAIQFARYGDLSSFGNKLSFLASKTKEGTEMLDKEFKRLEPILTELAKKEQEKNVHPKTCNNLIKDPIRVRTKGTQSTQVKSNKKRKPPQCSSCKNYGHTKTTCSQRKRSRKRL